MDALVIERVVRPAEELLERFAVVERGVMFAGQKWTVLTLSSETMSRNWLKRCRRTFGSSVVCVRSPVKTMKSGGSASALTAATAFLRVPFASGFGGPSNPQCASES